MSAAGRPSKIAAWRRGTLEVQASAVVAGHVEGPEPPRAWATRLRSWSTRRASREEGPSWWTPTNAYFGSVETRTDPRGYHWDGMKRLGRARPPAGVLSVHARGLGALRALRPAAAAVPPGTGFFAVVPSRHRYYLPEGSPGWTFGWIGIYHPYLVRRIAKQVAATGPVLQTPPGAPLARQARCGSCGARSGRTFRDRFEVELALFEFTARVRAARPARCDIRKASASGCSTRCAAACSRAERRRIGVDALAAERGMSRSQFSHFFRARTGTDPGAVHDRGSRSRRRARMLATTRAPLEQIADECGFAERGPLRQGVPPLSCARAPRRIVTPWVSVANAQKEEPIAAIGATAR